MARIEHPARRVQQRLHPLAEIVREFIRRGGGGGGTPSSGTGCRWREGG